MSFLYNITIRTFGLVIRSAAPFNDKAKKWLHGRKDLFSELENEFAGSEKKTGRIWFHCASLGEFEQGRPVIERLRKDHENIEIILTFFSPSGYEIRKNYEGADYIFYLPLDTPKNAAKFVDLINPVLAIFVKYEFWFNYLHALDTKNIPVVIISAIFRRNQHFFKWYGTWFRKQLDHVNFFFVQDQASYNLLSSIGVKHVIISGDTRFDRVTELASKAKKNPVVESFCNRSQVMLAGSTWPRDEEIILKLIGQSSGSLKIIFAPHEVDENRIRALQQKLSGEKVLRYSEANEENVKKAQILIIDGIGYLSSLYQYATIAYIGGGFVAGIHNILEAATFGKPVIFGPNYNKFKEAVDLVEAAGAFCIHDQEELVKTADFLLDNQKTYQNASQICREYVEKHAGATGVIVETLSRHRF